MSWGIIFQTKFDVHHIVRVDLLADTTAVVVGG
jgi:hypothetical protein